MSLQTQLRYRYDKTIGSVHISGDLGSTTTSQGLKFQANAIAEISDAPQGITIGTTDVGLLYIINQPGNNFGDVYKGPSGPQFLNEHLSFTQDIRASITPGNNKFSVNIKDRFARKDEDETTIYRFRGNRLAAHTFTQGEITARVTENAPQVVGPGGVFSDNTAATAIAMQSLISEDATIIEWVREGGTYVDDSDTDIKARRDAGVIMKSGFTTATNPYSAQGISDSLFRFSAKAAGAVETVTGNEELGGSVTLTSPAQSYTYNVGDSDFAIQIGTTDSGVAQRLNEVFIPNLLVKNFSVDAGGDTFIGIGSLRR